MFIILRDGTGLLQCVLSNVLVSIAIILIHYYMLCIVSNI